MLNKTEYEEPASVTVKPGKKGNGNIVKSSAAAAKDSSVSIAAKNENIPVAEHLMASRDDVLEFYEEFWEMMDDKGRFDRQILRSCQSW